MNKPFYILLITILFACSDEKDNQKEVCRCIKVYDDKLAYEKKLEREGVVLGEATDMAKEKYGKKMEECVKFSSEVGNKKFFEMSKKCK